jgi:hypothetical protein
MAASDGLAQAAGALAIWLDLPAESEAMVCEWFNREHHAERVDVPGFLSARRYLAVQGAPRHFILYGTRDVAVLSSSAYRERLDRPTEWTRRAMPSFRNMSRTACHVLQRLGRGEGGTVGTWRLGALPGREQALVAWLREDALPAALQRPGMVSTLLLRGEPPAGPGPTAEQTLRGGTDAAEQLILLVSANAPEPLLALHEEALSEPALARAGAQPGGAFGIYRLAFAL